MKICWIGFFAYICQTNQKQYNNKMKKLTIRHSVGSEIKNMIPELIGIALDHMGTKYPHVDFTNVDFIFTKTANRSRYFPNVTTTERFPRPCVSICTRGILKLYDKRSLGIKNTTVYTGPRTQIICALIHELTHHAQQMTQVRIGNELDTTKNELEYLREFEPEIFTEITTTK